MHIFRANVNDLIDKAENPEKIVKLIIIDKEKNSDVFANDEFKVLQNKSAVDAELGRLMKEMEEEN